MLWNIFRQFDNVKTFYEPLHDGLKTYIRYPIPTQDEHHFVNSYFDEYAPLSEALSLHQNTFSSNRLHLESSDSHDELKNYLDALIDAVPDQTLGFFKFNRIDFRLGWIKKHYPQIPLLHLVRNPRDQWQSSLGIYRPAVDREIDSDYYYTTTWARDLYQQFPFLASPQIEHSYQRFYYLWKLSGLAGKRTADLSVHYEDLLANPVPGFSAILKLSGIYSEQNLNTCLKYILASPDRSWTQDRPDAWFNELEQKCDAVLDQFGLLENFALTPLSEIQNASPIYLSALNNPRNEQWALKSFKQVISDVTMSGYEADCGRKQEYKALANRLEHLEKAFGIEKSENEQALKVAVQEKESMRRELESEKTRSSQLEAEYAKILNSRSYRLTGFVRALVGRLRILREGLKRMTGRQW